MPPDPHPAAFLPRVTVAAVVERDDRFLLVEELIDGRRVWNQPAGHLDPGEDLVAAAVRETREETGYRLLPQALVGVYLWTHRDGTTFLRTAVAGHVEGAAGVPGRDLDVEILGVHWRTRAELAAPGAPLRSPLVLRCVDDWLAGARHALDVLVHVPGRP